MCYYRFEQPELVARVNHQYKYTTIRTQTAHGVSMRFTSFTRVNEPISAIIAIIMILIKWAEAGCTIRTFIYILIFGKN